MNVERKKSKIKGYRSKKHEFEIEKTTMTGYTFITLKKNGNPILKCTPVEFMKFKKFICE
tara:strand:+ start:192 stop:371 length:180 start_codon:yes stop_codon:yes gene_type:complete